MGFAFAELGWSPRTFWAATPHELFAAIETRLIAASAKD
jgi:hypothetical protein